MASMFIKIIVLCLFSIYLDPCNALNYGTCILEGKANTTEHLKALSRLSSLINTVWTVEGYTVAICKGLVGVTDNKKLIYGRTNCTHAIEAESWVLLEYRSGDPLSTSSCQGVPTSQILILCDQSTDKEAVLKIVDQSECTLHFQLLTPAVCPPTPTSPGKIFFIIVLVLICLYFVVGAIYRRLTKNARGCQQLPHLSVWSKIGGLCADGCDKMCRCDEEDQDRTAADVWVEDRDDVLLRP